MQQKPLPLITEKQNQRLKTYSKPVSSKVNRRDSAYNGTICRFKTIKQHKYNTKKANHKK